MLTKLSTVDKLRRGGRSMVYTMYKVFITLIVFSLIMADGTVNTTDTYIEREIDTKLI